jgi:hypothetical protein
VDETELQPSGENRDPEGDAVDAPT